MSARAAELRAKGIEVFNFTVGEPDFEPPRHVLAAAESAVRKGVSKYTAVPGIAPLREAIVKSIKARTEADIGPTNVCVGTGAKSILYNIATALFEPGDEVIIPAPYWVSYPEQVRMMGATPVFVETDPADRFCLRPEALKKAITKRTKALLLNSPCNPTGMAYTREETRAILDVAKEGDFWIITDEIYAALLFDGRAPASVYGMGSDLRDRILLVDGVSKAYAMTGWRIGWIVGPRNVIAACELVQGQSTSHPAAIAQSAALAALTGPQGDIEIMRAAFQKRRDVLVEEFKTIPGIVCPKPEGAFYAFLDARGVLGKSANGKKMENDLDFATYLVEEAHVVTVPGTPFGAPGFLRMSFAVSEETLRRGTKAIREAVSKLS